MNIQLPPAKGYSPGYLAQWGPSIASAGGNPPEMFIKSGGQVRASQSVRKIQSVRQEGTKEKENEIDLGYLFLVPLVPLHLFRIARYPIEFFVLNFRNKKIFLFSS